VSWKRSRTTRLIVTFGVALLACSGAYAYTASNNVPTTNAGFGTGAVSAYTVGTAQFTLNTNSDPTQITQISFPLTPTSAQTVDIQLGNGSAWYSCSGGATATCSSLSSPSQAVVTTGLSSMTVAAAQ
jgi:hypothetical protein